MSGGVCGGVRGGVCGGVRGPEGTAEGATGIMARSPPAPAPPTSPASPPSACGTAAAGTYDHGGCCCGGGGGGGGGGSGGGSGGGGGRVGAARELRAPHRLQAAAFAKVGRAVARRPLAVMAS